MEWIEADANFVRLQVGRETHLLREKIKVLEGGLDPGMFVRVHRSAIVRIDQIKELRMAAEGEHIIILQNGARLSLSRTYHQRFREICCISPQVFFICLAQASFSFRFLDTCTWFPGVGRGPVANPPATTGPKFE